MTGDILKYVSVFLLSMVKFFGGPLAGISMGLSFGMTLALTVTGMMTSVFIFSWIGCTLSEWYAVRCRQRQKPVFTKRSRNIVKIWQRFGMTGIAFLTPVLFSPIIGTIVATVLGVSQRKIILNMLWSALFWGVAFTFLIIQFRHIDLPFINK